MKDPLVSVVVPTYNRHETLRNALRSLRHQETDDELPFEIVVIDNASTEATKAVVAELAEGSPVDVRYVREEKEGYSQALNRGVREARGTWLAFFDDDQLAERDWLKELLAAASETGAKVVGGNIRLELPREGTPPLGPVCRSLLGEHDYGGTARVCLGKSVPSGGNLLVARDVFDVMGLFDTSMVVGGCDAELVRRARVSGGTVAIAPAASVSHVIPPYRLMDGYLRWTSMRWGYLFAYIDYRNSGSARTYLYLFARVGQAILVNLPLWLMSVATRNAMGALDRKCLLWRAIGYACGTASISIPHFLKKPSFFSRFEFRRERTAFSQS